MVPLIRVISAQSRKQETMSLISVAVLSKDNRPLYLKEFNGSIGSASVEGSSRSGDSSDDLFDVAREASTLSVSSTSTSTSSAGGAWSTGPIITGIGQSCSIDQQFLLHTALGRLEQLTEPKGQGAAWRFGRPNQLGHEAMWVGLVGHVDDVRLYAYVTTTKVKIIVACEDTFLPGQAEQGRAHDVALKNLMVSKSQVLPHRRNDIFPMFVYSCHVDTSSSTGPIFSYGRSHFLLNPQRQIKIHSLYCDHIANPFTDINENTIRSTRFDNAITANANAFNRNPAFTMR